MHMSPSEKVSAENHNESLAGLAIPHPRKNGSSILFTILGLERYTITRSRVRFGSAIGLMLLNERVLTKA